MLKKVLIEIENSKNGLNLNELSHKLNLDRSALNGMIEFWVQKGRLVDDDAEEAISCSSSCGSSCSSDDGLGCSFVMEMPKTYSLRKSDKTL
ncbi:MAG: hypothetical protein HN392_11620 [Anaerolineae bacterium]|jgi:hypothetical protein|nr:hypothetical protein [Anaerolineae bacterium]MBT7074704.1 hypothetical protein [Anaerolineae bacterium]MBT7782421.1 hypothetical protein [Anaerolineae bacterium]